MPTRWTEARVRSHDGTELAVQVGGEGPLVVLANGLGGSLSAWGPFLEQFGTGRRIASWDYRGLYRSGPPARPEAVTVEDHAGDLAAVLDWLGGDPAVLVGWSMGVQVVVAHALAHPDDARALVLVAGAPGDPLAGVFHTTASRRLVPPLTQAVEAAALLFGLLMRAVTAAPRPAARALRTGGVLRAAPADRGHRALPRRDPGAAPRAAPDVVRRGAVVAGAHVRPAPAGEEHPDREPGDG